MVGSCAVPVVVGGEEEARGRSRSSYSIIWTSTGPPSLTSTYRLWPSSSRIPTSGVVSATLTLMRLRRPSHSTEP